MSTEQPGTDEDFGDVVIALAFQAAHAERLAEALAEALNELDMEHNHKTLCRAKEKARDALAQWEASKNQS